MTDDQKNMQYFVSKILNFRKNSEVIHNGKTLHFAPFNGTYFLFRVLNDQVVVHIINKNDAPITIDLIRYAEVGLAGKKMKNIMTGEDFIWGNEIYLSEKGSIILTTEN